MDPCGGKTEILQNKSQDQVRLFLHVAGESKSILLRKAVVSSYPKKKKKSVLWLQCILSEVWFFYWLSPWCRHLQAGRWGRRLWATQGRPGPLGAPCGWPDRALRISHQPPAGPLTRPLLCATRGRRCWWMAVPAGNTSARRRRACRDGVSFISDSEDISPCFDLLVCDVPGASRWVAVSEGTEGAVHSLIGQLSLITWWERQAGIVQQSGLCQASSGNVYIEMFYYRVLLY